MFINIFTRYTRTYTGIKKTTALNIFKLFTNFLKLGFKKKGKLNASY